MGLHNPLPSSMASECKKCGKILNAFIDPRQSFGPDKVIPPNVLSNAKGLAILTVIKAGFIGSGRFGSGLVVARLPDGSWSAPSAVCTAGAGVGGQIGFELTDFVFILNDANAVRSFAQQGSITLGGNVSIAAGPVGRNAEAAGAASLKGVAGVFSYSRTKGLFAGVSLEGSAIIERRDANEKLYNTRYTAAQLLSGSVASPPQAAPLMEVLNSRVFMGMRSGAVGDVMYNDAPVQNGPRDDVVWEGRQDAAGAGAGVGAAAAARRNSGGHAYGQEKRTSSWRDDDYDRDFSRPQRASTYGVADTKNANGPASPISAAAPGRPAAPKPNFGAKTALMKKNEAVALFTFEADQPGDLGFKKGDIITVLKKTESDNDWWTGMIGTRHGTFPSNYVKMKE